MNKLKLSFLIVLFLSFISLLHYFTNLAFLTAHVIFQRLYYLPIIFAAFVYGFKGGLVTALVATLFYAPHVFSQWHDAKFYFQNQIGEMVMFNVVGIITGLFSDRLKRQVEQTEKAYKQLESAFEKAEKSARMAAIGQLSAAMAHEIRNPLAGIKGAFEIIAKKISKDDKEYQFVDVSQKEINRLEKLTTDFLSFAKPKPPKKLKITIDSALRSVVDLCREKVIKNNIELKLDISENNPTVNIDVDQIKQVFLNIILNSIEAIGNDGILTISAFVRKNCLIIRFSDTGRGMDSDTINKIYEPFFTTKTSGTGLGLSVSYQIIKQHDGNILVESKLGEGSIFDVELPIA